MTALRIALVGPEFEENLGLRYLHAALGAAGHTARILDFRDSTQAEAVAREIARWPADVVGLSMTFARRGREFADLATRLREVGFVGHLTCGGHFATLHAEALLRDVPALDSVVLGEGEEALVELLAHLEDPSGVAGLCYRRADGAVARTAPRPVPDSLEGRAWPTREKKLDAILGLPMVDVVSGRGCWASCRFCSIEAWHRAVGGKRFRQRSVEDVADEVAALYGRGARLFNFTDDNFFLPDPEANVARFRALREALTARGVGRVALQVKARPESIPSQPILEALRALGVFRIFLGVESDSARSLEAMGRASTREQNRGALERIVDAGFHVSYNLQLFGPETTLAEIRENLNFVRRFALVPMGFCRTEVYGGTALEAQLRGQGRLEGDYFHYDYVITDPAAEAVYRAQYAVLGKRAFDLAEGMGPRSMALDHQLHLLEHQWPGRVPASLRKRVKAFTADLNAHTVAILAEICDLAERSPAQVQAEVPRWRAACEAFDQAMDTRSKRLFVELAGLAGVSDAVARFRFPFVETSVVCLLLFVAAIAVVTVFGQNLRALFAASSELAGEEYQPRKRTPPRQASEPSRKGAPRE